MDHHGLNDEEWRCLERFTRDQHNTEASLDVLAKLEQLGLLMRAWGPTYVVTARGEALLRESRS
ncbi:MAG TPA: hypothetical protein VNX47_06360 [Nevskia sp.]|nr:hypothetical protein [Nevskia sp.]